MISRRAFLYTSSLLALGLASPLAAITTVEVEVICPVCGTKNQFMEYASWGSYIYAYPSKFQLVFWPHTWNATIYCCKQCHLSAFMWDFKEFPKEKVAASAQLLKSVEFPGHYKKYTDIPASNKLAVAEKIYALLERDDAFWNLFYRVVGYHCAVENKTDEAAGARRRALGIAQRMLADPAQAGHKKELLVIAASMHHFTGNDADSLKELHQAAKETFSDAQLGGERSKNYDQYLASLINEFKTAIQAGSVPDGTKGE